MGSKAQPRTESEELTFYKTQVKLRELVNDKQNYENLLANINEQMREHILTLSIWMGAPKLSEILGIPVHQASRLLAEITAEAGG